MAGLVQNTCLLAGLTMYTPSISESDVFTALRSWLLLVVPTAEVVQGLDNLVPMPLDACIVMTMISHTRIGTNTDALREIVDGVEQDITSSWQYAIQVDCFGNNSGNQCLAIATLWRDDFAVSQFPSNISPLYADDPRQIAFVDDQMQYDRRWMTMLHVQVDPVITTPAQSAPELVTPIPQQV